MEFKEYTDKYETIKKYIITLRPETESNVESLNSDRIRIISVCKLEINNTTVETSFHGVFKLVDGEKIQEVECISINGTGFQLNEHTSSRITNDSQFQEVYDAIREQQIAKDLFEF